jgi:alkylation response protein AidB-like acyl-CoA dehydrogenase
VATMIEFGRSLVVEPYLATVSCAGGLICAGNNEEFKASIIPEVAAGTQILAFAHEERGTRGNSLNIALMAEKQGDNFILSGEKLGVHAATIADKWVVTCRTSGKVGDEQGLSILLVDAFAEGIVRTDLTNIDGFKSANVQFNNVCVSSSNLLSAQGEAASVLREVFKSAITLLCAEAVGAMEVLLDATVQYSKDREQFDKPIGSFQALKHSIVDMFIALESSSAVLMGTAAMVEAGSCSDRDISILKAQIGEAGRYIGQQAVQVHGGMGMTDEVTVGYYLKRLLAIDAIFGNTDYNRFY